MSENIGQHGQGQTSSTDQYEAAKGSLAASGLPKAEIAHERVMFSEQFCPVRHVGYLGGRREQLVERMNKLFGPENWTLGYRFADKFISRDDALALYLKSYEKFLRDNPNYTANLLSRARDVYDTSPSNVESGTDWHH